MGNRKYLTGPAGEFRDGWPRSHGGPTLIEDLDTTRARPL
jgi:hypothetical protein